MFKQFRKIEKDPIKPGPKSVMSEARKKNSKGGIYGFVHKKNNTLDYIGRSNNLYERVIINHQKPSADLARKMVRDRTGMSGWDYEQKYGILEGQRIYFKKAKEILGEYEVIVLEDVNSSVIEGGLIRHYKLLGQAKFNKQNY
tara:strand:+ start:83 stop:511 length:429 start_codon:yes stop_codon:yes gene_type:complete